MLIILVHLSSCKKTSSSNTSDMTVRYEVSWNNALATGFASPINQLSYLNSTGNTQFDTLSGTSYSKSVLISNTANIKVILAQALVVMQQPGTGEIKIFINDVLQADQIVSSTAIPSPASNGSTDYLLTLIVHWDVK